MAARNFPDALKQAMAGLEMTQQQFADAVRISQSMVTKLLQGRRGRDRTYVKILAYFRKAHLNVNVETGRKRLGAMLRDALYKDMDETLGWVDDEPSGGSGARERTDADRLLSSLFCNIPDPVIFALVAVGLAADRNAAPFNALLAQAEACRSADPQVGAQFPEGYFSQSLRRPKENVFLGGTLGEIANTLARRRESSAGQPLSTPDSPGND